MNQRWEFVASDFFFSSGESKNTQLFQYGEETMHAWEEGRLSDDIIAEQRKVEAAELIIFQVRGQRQEAVVRSRDLALTELDCVCVCLCFRSSRCTGSVFRPSWRAGSTECWHKASPSHWCTCTTTAFLRSVWRADAPIKVHFKEPF